jgi:hypothetical protein
MYVPHYSGRDASWCGKRVQRATWLLPSSCWARTRSPAASMQEPKPAARPQRRERRLNTRVVSPGTSAMFLPMRCRIPASIAANGLSVQSARLGANLCTVTQSCSTVVHSSPPGVGASCGEHGIHATNRRRRRATHRAGEGCHSQDAAPGGRGMLFPGRRVRRARDVFPGRRVRRARDAISRDAASGGRAVLCPGRRTRRTSGAMPGAPRPADERCYSRGAASGGRAVLFPDAASGGRAVPFPGHRVRRARDGIRRPSALRAERLPFPAMEPTQERVTATVYRAYSCSGSATFQPRTATEPVRSGRRGSCCSMRPLRNVPRSAIVPYTCRVDDVGDSPAASGLIPSGAPVGKRLFLIRPGFEQAEIAHRRENRTGPPLSASGR